MAKMRDQRGGRWFFVAIIVLAFAAYSLAMAAITADECGDVSKHWQFIPPEWECTPGRTFG